VKLTVQQRDALRALVTGAVAEWHDNGPVGRLAVAMADMGLSGKDSAGVAVRGRALALEAMDVAVACLLSEAGVEPLDLWPELDQRPANDAQRAIVEENAADVPACCRPFGTDNRLTYRQAVIAIEVLNKRRLVAARMRQEARVRA